MRVIQTKLRKRNRKPPVIENPTVKCSKCDKFMKTSRLSKHLERWHVEKGAVHKCSVCTKILEDEPRLGEHEQLHTSENLFHCVICGLNLRSTFDLQLHVTRIHDALEFKCPIEDCEYSFGTEDRLKNHLKRSHYAPEKTLECSECPYKTANQDTLKWHMLRHTNAGAHPCTFQGCNRTFYHSTVLKRHIRVHHEESNPFECKICGKKFKYNQSLRRHEMQHGEERPFMCEICSDTFKVKKNFRNHQKVHANGRIGARPRIRRSRAEVSDTEIGRTKRPKTTSTASGDKDEKSKSSCKKPRSTERPFSCQICNKSYNTNCYRKKHEEMHKTRGPIIRGTGRRQTHPPGVTFSCRYCGQTFKENRRRNDHEAYHRDERPHLCDLCPAAFKVKGDLSRHRRKHSTGLNYKYYKLNRKKDTKLEITTNPSIQGFDKILSATGGPILPECTGNSKKLF